MSRTDSTRPYWVQLRDPLFPYVLQAIHRHKGRECGLDFPLPTTRCGYRGCEIWTRYRDNDKIYGRRRWRRTHPGQEGRARASLRHLRGEWLKTAPRDREDLDSTEDAPTSRWLWRRWYWD